MRTSSQSWMASRMLAMASFFVLPWLMQPGKLGHSTTHQPSSPGRRRLGAWKPSRRIGEWAYLTLATGPPCISGGGQALAGLGQDEVKRDVERDGLLAQATDGCAGPPHEGTGPAPADSIRTQLEVELGEPGAAAKDAPAAHARRVLQGGTDEPAFVGQRRHPQGDPIALRPNDACGIIRPGSFAARCADPPPSGPWRSSPSRSSTLCSRCRDGRTACPWRSA